MLAARGARREPGSSGSAAARRPAACRTRGTCSSGGPERSARFHGARCGGTPTRSGRGLAGGCSSGRTARRHAGADHRTRRGEFRASPASRAGAETGAAAGAEVSEVTIPAGTALSVTVLSTLGSNTSQVEDPVRGALAEPVVVSGHTALPKGTEITGTVTDAKDSGRVKGKASIAFRFERVRFDNENLPIQTARVTIEAAQNKGDDVKKGGAGAGLGAIVGGIAGGGKVRRLARSREARAPCWRRRDGRSRSRQARSSPRWCSQP